MFTEAEQKAINEWKSKEIARINSANLTDEQKQDRIDLVESTEFSKLKSMTVKEVAPHQWEAY